MKVNHKTFIGGYKFSNFEGQPSGSVQRFTPGSNVADLAIKPGEGVSAGDVLNAMGLTAFKGPDCALVPTEGLIDAAKVTDIVVNAVSAEPYELPAEILVKEENINAFSDGLKLIHDSYEKAKVTLVLGEDQEKLFGLFSTFTDNLSWLDVCTVTSKYPANLKELQIPLAIGKTYPVGYDPAHIGVLFLSVSDVLTVEKAVSRNGDPSTTYVALSGTGWKENLVLEVPVGTAVRDLTAKYLGDVEIRLVKNSVVTGPVLNDEDLITYDTDVVIALPEDRRRQTLFFLRAGGKADSFSNSFLSRLMPKAEKTAGTNLNGERRACVSCTYCQSICPVGLIPHLLHKHVDKDIISERLAEYRIFDCIECGLCDYVCPSKIEISSHIKLGKEKLEKLEISHNNYLIPRCDMILEVMEVAADE